MAFAPRAAVTKRLLTGAKCLIPLAILYGVLLLASWTPETLSTLLPGDFLEGMKSALEGKPKMQFLPDIEAVGKLLSAPIASISAWAHLQFIAFFCARWIWLDGVDLSLLHHLYAPNQISFGRRPNPASHMQNLQCPQ